MNEKLVSSWILDLEVRVENKLDFPLNTKYALFIRWQDMKPTLLLSLLPPFLMLPSNSNQIYSGACGICASSPTSYLG
jgi:hypothetical protein